MKPELAEESWHNMKSMNFLEELGKISPKAKIGANIYFLGCGQYFEDLRRLYRGFTNANLEDYALAFLDNDKSKQGRELYGKPILNPDSIVPNNSIVLITAVDYPDYAIHKQMMDKGFFWKSDLFDTADIFGILKSYIFNCFIELKNRHKGKRCFIVGGGASLKMSDLDILKDESTFGMNKIYKAFCKTKWRPTYYLSNDPVMLSENYEIISELIKGVKFFEFGLCSYILSKDITLHFENMFFYSSITVINRPAEYKIPSFGEFPDVFIVVVHLPIFVCN